MIPKNINQKHILKAIKEIDINGVPKGRASRKFLLKYKTKTYPPKYTVGLANKFANGKELNPDRYSGGVGETNAFLKRLGLR